MQEYSLPAKAAGRLHDIGSLHINGELLDHSRRTNDAERQHLHADLLTAWMILNEFQEYSADVLDAVLRHHERLVESAPRHLKGMAPSYRTGLLRCQIGRLKIFYPDDEGSLDCNAAGKQRARTSLDQAERA